MSDDRTIDPDTKNWTWVLERVCPECKFDVRALDAATTGDEIRRLGNDWAAVLTRTDVRTRPVPNQWSPLEYGCHIRDVFDLYDHRLELMLTQDDPLFQNWDQDVTAIEKDYGAQDPRAVTEELLAAATVRLAARFDTVTGEQWQRTGRRSDGVAFTIESFARYLVHDPVHHLWDVQRTG